VTYFPKIPLAPVPLAWTATPQHPSSKQHLGTMPFQCTRPVQKHFWSAGSGLTELGAEPQRAVICGGDRLVQIRCLMTLECINELIYQAATQGAEETLPS
jgi:hypothetical protein